MDAEQIDSFAAALTEVFNLSIQTVGKPDRISEIAIQQILASILPFANSLLFSQNDFETAS